MRAHRLRKPCEDVCAKARGEGVRSFLHRVCRLHELSVEVVRALYERTVHFREGALGW